MNPYERNIWLLYALSFVNAFIFSWGVIHVLFLQAVDFSFFQISILLAVWSVTFIIAEIFTGMFADLYGRKNSLLLTGVFAAMAVSVYSFFPTYSLLLIAAVFFALSSSFLSGSFDSLLFESLRTLNRKKEYTKVLGRNHFLFVALGIATNFFIPQIFEQNIMYPFYIGLGFSGLGLIIASLLHDDVKRRQGHLLPTFHRHLKTSFSLVLHNKKLLWLLFYAGIIGIGIGIFGDVLNQPFIKEGRSLYTYGVVFSLASAVQALFVFRLDSFISFIGRSRIYTFLMIAFPLGLLLLFIPNDAVVIFVLGFLWMLGTLRAVFFSERINTWVKKDAERATVHSINSMFEATVYLLFAPLLGIAFDAIGVSVGVLLLAAIALILPGITLLFKPNSI